MVYYLVISYAKPCKRAFTIVSTAPQKISLISVLSTSKPPLSHKFLSLIIRKNLGKNLFIFDQNDKKGEIALTLNIS